MTNAVAFNIDSSNVSKLGFYDNAAKNIAEHKLDIKLGINVEEVSITLTCAKLKARDYKFEVINLYYTCPPGETDPYTMELFLKTENNICHLLMYRSTKTAYLNIWSLTLEGTHKVYNLLLDWLPKEPKAEGANQVAMRFWHFTGNGKSKSVSKNLLCPPYQDIQDNYSSDVKSKLQELLQLQSPESLGKIILWHGPPGTGKTHMIRALAQAWKEKLDIEVITDPEVLFKNSTYFFDLLMDRESSKARLFIIEDQSELFSKDNGCRLNAGFSRLLNITDGLIGQGQKLIFLFTCNEPIETIDEALLRPGRCLMNLEFPPLPVDQANAWLLKNKTTITVEEPTTLSDLYALLNSKLTAEEFTDKPSNNFGFTALTALKDAPEDVGSLIRKLGLVAQQ